MKQRKVSMEKRRENSFANIESKSTTTIKTTSENYPREKGRTKKNIKIQSTDQRRESSKQKSFQNRKKQSVLLMMMIMSEK